MMAPSLGRCREALVIRRFLVIALFCSCVSARTTLRSENRLVRKRSWYPPVSVGLRGVPSAPVLSPADSQFAAQYALAASKDPHFDGSTVQGEDEYDRDFTEDDLPDWEVAEAEVHRARSQLAKEKAEMDKLKALLTEEKREVYEQVKEVKKQDAVLQKRKAELDKKQGEIDEAEEEVEEAEEEVHVAQKAIDAEVHDAQKDRKDTKDVAHEYTSAMSDVHEAEKNLMVAEKNLAKALDAKKRVQPMLKKPRHKESQSTRGSGQPRAWPSGLLIFLAGGFGVLLMR